MRRYSREDSSEGQSKDTKFAGLPKAVRIRRNAAHNIIAGAFTVIQFDVQDFNYGPFIVELGTATTGVTVTEPGVYEALSRMAIVNGPANEYYHVINVNGVQLAIGTHPNTGVNPRWSVTDRFELKAQDKITVTTFCTATNTTIATTEPFLYVEKKGGQY